MVISQDTIWVGLDVHAESIVAAVLYGLGDEPEVIRLSGDLNKVRQLFRRLSARGPVRACYEASGAGFVLQRTLAHDGFACEVIAPSLIPRRPGEHRKTDRLDAMMLARLYRSGHLTPVHIPTEDHEAVRRLLRLRESYHTYITATMHRVSGMLRNHGFVFKEGKCTWTKKHRTWLATLRTSLTGPLEMALAMELEHLEYLEMQQHALDTQIETLAADSRFRRAAEALCCLRGVKTLTALSLLVEIGDIHRFPSPRGLMAYFGLVPSEHSSGNKEYRGSITKAGNCHIRRLLVEAAWNNHHNAGAALMLQRRRQGQPPDIVAIAAKAQHRLVRKFLRLDARKHRHVAITAVARELCGFIWAILMALPEPQH
jgi:transposase